MTKEEEKESNMANPVFNHREAGPLRTGSSKVFTSSTNRIMGEKCKSDSTNCDDSVPCKIKKSSKEHNSKVNFPGKLLSLFLIIN